MHAIITLPLPANGVTGIALHLLSMRIMPVMMWDVVLVALACVVMATAMQYKLLLAEGFHSLIISCLPSFITCQTEDACALGEPHKPSVKWL